ncbi:cell cycle checkpoint protein RAD17 [Spatholobus suberectus]|nr:cell cycle checkpoint protein RAD17 [Spatholobus suberectus]
MFSLTFPYRLSVSGLKNGRETPDAETVKTGGCSIFKELCTIFSEPETNGKHEHLAASEGEHTSRTLCPQPLNIHQEESSSESQDEEDVMTLKRSTYCNFYPKEA